MLSFIRALFMLSCVLFLVTACGVGGNGDMAQMPDPPPPEPPPPSLQVWAYESGRIDGEDILSNSRRSQSSYTGNEASFPAPPDLIVEQDQYRRRENTVMRYTVPFSQTSGQELVERGGRAETVDFTAYGGWLAHSYFEVVVEEPTLRGDGYSLGNTIFTNPVESATYRGAMVAHERGRPGTPIYGGADLVFDAATSTLDMTLTPEGRGNLTWYDVPVSRGEFRVTDILNRMVGRFYGPDNEEAGGVFERNNLVGAFGASRE